jgi:hypothetical protein
LFSQTHSTFCIFQLPVTHDDIFGEYECRAKNKMGELTRKVQLSEGAKPGIPIMEISRIDRDTAEMIILVSTWSFATIFTKRNINKYIHATSLDPPFRNIRQSYIFTLLALKLSTKKSI